MKPAKDAFKRGRAEGWTPERVAELSKHEIQQLQANAERLGESALAALCAEALKALPRGRAAAAAGPRPRARRLVSRGKAFEARGVWLQDARSSWGGVRKSDGMVVMTLWADAIEAHDGACHYLLWAPNLDGSRPWSDSAPGRERLEHCRMLSEGTSGEGLLVYGERLAGHLPEERARSVHGVDPETVVRFRVEKRGEEYWAVWGRSPAPA